MVRLKDPQRRALGYALLAVLGGLFLISLTGGGARQATPAESPAWPGGGGALARPGTPPAVPSSALSDRDEERVISLERSLAADLERVLGAIAGAGQVRVQVTLAGAGQREYARDRTSNHSTTQERDVSGGQRVVTQDEEQDKVVAVQAGGGQEPLIHQLKRPEVLGVLVVAEGAWEPELRATLARAVGTALGVPLHRVTVLPGQGGQGGQGGQ